MGLAALLTFGPTILAIGLVASPRQGRVMLGGASATIVGWATHTVFLLAPTIAVTFAEGLITAFEENRDLWARVVAIFVRELTGSTAGVGDIESAIRGGGLAGASPAIAKPLVDIIAAAIAPQGELTPERGVENLEAILGLNVLLGLQGWWTQAVGDMVSLGKFGSAADLPDALERALGLNRLGRLVWRTPVKKGIAEPLEVLYNRLYQFKRLTPTEAANLWHRDAIDDETFLEAAQDAGYSHDRAMLLLGLARKEWTPAQLRDLWRFHDLPEEAVLQILQRQGYTAGMDTTLFTLLAGEEKIRLMRELEAQSRRLYRRGDFNDGDLRAVLLQSGLRDDEISIVIATETLARQDEKRAPVGDVLRAYQEAVLSAEETRQRLRTEGYPETDIDLLLALQVKRLSSGQLVEAFIRGRLTREEVTQRLVAQGYREDEIPLLLDLRGRQLSEGQILDALREGLINIQQAREELQALGFEASAIEVLLAFARRTLSPADIQAAVLRGLLSADEARQRLLEDGYSPDDAEIIVTLRRRLLSRGEIMDAFTEGLLGRSEAIAALQQHGFTEDDALTIVRLVELAQAARPEAAPQAPPRAAARAPRAPLPPRISRRRPPRAPQAPPAP